MHFLLIRRHCLLIYDWRNNIIFTYVTSLYPHPHIFVSHALTFISWNKQAESRYNNERKSGSRQVEKNVCAKDFIFH